MQQDCKRRDLNLIELIFYCFLAEEMLSNSSINSSTAISSFHSSIPAWSQIEPALNQLFPSPGDLDKPTSLTSDDFLKLYTVVFEHCVGSTDGKKSSASSKLNLSGEELYMTLVKYLETKFTSWSQFLVRTT